MLRRLDYLGLEYLHCEVLRAKKSRTSAEKRELAAHDAEERRIQDQPEVVLREAYQGLDRGTGLILKLIRSQKLLDTLYPTEVGMAKGLKPIRSDGAMLSLGSRLNFLNRQLIRLAEENVPGACHHLWFAAHELAEAFSRIALLHEQEFRCVAASSLTMPSLRANDPKYKADAEGIAKAIHLSKEHPMPKIGDDRKRIGALCHPIVVALVANVFRQRREYDREKENLAQMQEFPETAEKYRGVTLERYLRSRMQPSSYDHLMACVNLPDWHTNRAAWWQGRILPMVKEEFYKLHKDPKRHPALWKELGAGQPPFTENGMRRDFEKNCCNKFKQLTELLP